jgi:hypothetical protein
MEMFDTKAPTNVVPAQFPTPFSDQAVPQEVATALRQAAERIRRFGDQQNKTILAIGRELVAVEELLPSHLLGPWIRKEFGMTDETAGAYVAATRKIAADAASGRPRLMSWHPDRERNSGACGIVEIELPSGVKFACPVFDATELVPTHIQPEEPDYVSWPVALFPHEFQDDILARIREVDPGAFKEDRSPGDVRDSSDLRSSSPPAFLKIDQDAPRLQE